MKKIVSLFVVFSMFFCFVSPVFSEDKTPLTADQIKEQIAEQNRHVDSGADNFLSGIIVGAVSAATLIPASMLIEENNGTLSKVIYITAGAMSLITVILISWGGAEWLAANGKIEELKKAQKDLTVAPYFNPIAQSGAELGLGINIRI